MSLDKSIYASRPDAISVLLNESATTVEKSKFVYTAYPEKSKIVDIKQHSLYY